MKKVIIISAITLLSGCVKTADQIEEEKRNNVSKDSALKLVSNINSMYNIALAGFQKKHIDDSLQVLNYEKYYGIVADENQRLRDSNDSLNEFIDTHTKFYKIK